jgi:hypothetical protein
MKVTALDLLALARNNDPFAAEVNGRRRAAEWFIDTANKLDLGETFHTRRMHYRIVMRPELGIGKPDGTAYLNTYNDWTLLTQACRDARYLGLIHLSRITDNRNPDPIICAEFSSDADPGISLIGDDLFEMDIPETLDLPELVLSGFCSQQAYLVEIWTEKSGDNDVLRPLAHKYGCNLVNFDGEGSEVGCRDAVRRAVQSNRPLRILYLSDFDPGGRSMPVAAARKLEFWLRYNHPDLDVTVDPLALLPEQAERFNLPRTMIKEGEKRAPKFEARFGRGGTEIDALEAVVPGELRKIVEAGILRHYDTGLALREDEARRRINSTIIALERHVHDSHDADIQAINEEYSDLREQLRELRERAGELWDQMASELRDGQPYVSVHDVPQPEPEAEQLAPLFDSKRDYLTQLDWYRHWQGRDRDEAAP